MCLWWIHKTFLCHWCMRWTCTQQEYEHQHSGCEDESLPNAFVRLFVTCSLTFSHSHQKTKKEKLLCAKLNMSVVFVALCNGSLPAIQSPPFTNSPFPALQELRLPVLLHVTPHFQGFHQWVTKSRKKAVGLPSAYSISRK